MGWERVCPTCFSNSKKRKPNNPNSRKNILFYIPAFVILCLNEILMRQSNFDVLYGSLKHNSTTSMNSCTVAQSKLNILWKHNLHLYFLEVLYFT